MNALIAAQLAALVQHRQKAPQQSMKGSTPASGGTSPHQTLGVLERHVTGPTRATEDLKRRADRRKESL